MAAAGLSLLRFVDVATRRSFPVFGSYTTCFWDNCFGCGALLVRFTEKDKCCCFGAVGMCSRPAGKLYRVWPHSGALRASSFVRTRSYVQQAQGDLPVSAKLAEEFTSQSPPAQTTDNAFIPDIGAEYEEINADVLEAEFSEVEEAEYADAELQDDDVADAEFEDEEVGEVKAESKSEAGAEDKDKEKDKEPEKVTITIPYVPVPEAQKAVEAMFKSSWTDMEPETKNTVISALRTRNGILLDCWDAYNDVVRFSEVFKRLTGELDEAREVMFLIVLRSAPFWPRRILALLALTVFAFYCWCRVTLCPQIY